MRLDVIVIYVDVQLICSSNNVYCSLFNGMVS
jgi:hypothetical protein